MNRLLVVQRVSFSIYGIRYTTFGNLRSHIDSECECDALLLVVRTQMYPILRRKLRTEGMYMDLWCLYWEEEKSERLSKGGGGGARSLAMAHWHAESSDLKRRDQTKHR